MTTENETENKTESQTENETVTEERQRVALASGAALLVAGLLLVMFVLPAEYAVDPLGTGARFGLLALGETGKRVEALEAAARSRDTGLSRAAPVAPQERELKTETIAFKLAPGEWVEYKYRLDRRATLLYSWHATGPVNVEFHAEPDGAPRGYAESYAKLAAQTQASGTLTAPFPGIHGWWWENATNTPVTLTLKSSGFFTLSHEFHAATAVKNRTF